MAKALTVELFAGVLAVLALDGCRAASEKASAEPAPAAPAATTAPPREEAPAAVEPAVPLAAAPATPVTGKTKAALIDAGVEETRKRSGPSPSAQAACGAGGCSADMKKGTK